MKPLNISLDRDEGVTLVSNIFIDQYMKDANDAQLKIYLYLLRMVGANLPTDISEIADIFNHTEKDVIKSLKYWERTGLMLLGYDEKGNISGVSLKTPGNNCKNENNTNDIEKTPDANVIVSKRREEPVVEQYTSSGCTKEEINVDMDYKAEKDSYSLEDIRQLKSNPEVSVLINVASQYFGRMFNPAELKTLIFIYDKLGFSMDLADYLIEYCADRNHKSMAYVEQTAINWYEAGIKSVDEAKLQSKHANKSEAFIMKALGKKGEPASIELGYIRKWLREYDFSLDIIGEACKRTVVKTDTNRFAYADSILSSWRDEGVHHLSDVDALDKKFEESKKMISDRKHAVSRKNAGSDQSDFCQLEKRDYDFDELERLALYSNVTSRK